MFEIAYICSPKVASSANKNILLRLLQTSGKSLMKIINNKGPKTVPCGIPLRTLFDPDNTPFILTCCILLHKKASIHAISFSSTLYDVSFLNNRLLSQNLSHTLCQKLFRNLNK